MRYNLMAMAAVLITATTVSAAPLSDRHWRLILKPNQSLRTLEYEVNGVLKNITIPRWGFGRVNMSKFHDDDSSDSDNLSDFLHRKHLANQDNTDSESYNGGDSGSNSDSEPYGGTSDGESDSDTDP